MARQGIDAPETAEEGSSAPIDVSGSSSSELLVTVIATGDEITVKLDKCGQGLFELPASARAGGVLTVFNPDDLDGCSAIILIVPASAP